MRVGILEQSGTISIPEEGIPQGSIISPILANIYPHEVLDKWFIENYASHNSIIVRYADDAVSLFRSKNNKRRLRIKTSKKTPHKKMQKFYNWIKCNRSMLKTSEIWETASAKLVGHYNYYGYWMNYTKLNHFYWEAIKSLFKWMNRRSQKLSFGWVEFCRKLKYNRVPRPSDMKKLKQLGWNPYAI